MAVVVWPVNWKGVFHFYSNFEHDSIQRYRSYSGRNFALLEFREMRDLEPKISRNLRNSQGIEIPMILLLYENTSSYFLSPKNAKLLLL